MYKHTRNTHIHTDTPTYTNHIIFSFNKTIYITTITLWRVYVLNIIACRLPICESKLRLHRQSRDIPRRRRLWRRRRRWQRCAVRTLEHWAFLIIWVERTRVRAHLHVCSVDVGRSCRLHEVLRACLCVGTYMRALLCCALTINVMCVRARARERQFMR